MAHWEVFDQLWPLGPAGEYERMAMICATIVNISGKSVNRNFTPHDFVPQFSFQDTPKTWDSVKAWFAAAAKQGI